LPRSRNAQLVHAHWMKVCIYRRGDCQDQETLSSCMQVLIGPIGMSLGVCIGSIRMCIIKAVTWGVEWWGMSLALASRMQTPVNRSMRIVSGCSAEHPARKLSDVNPIHPRWKSLQQTAARRTRAKGPSTRPRLNRMMASIPRYRKSVWV
jgi:hypothetical protein